MNSFKFFSARPGRRKVATAVSLFTMLALLLSACGGGQETTPAAEAQFTAAAQTAVALGAGLASQTPTEEPADLVATVAAPSPTMGLEPTSPLPPVGTPVGTPAGAAAPAGATPITGTTPNALLTPVATTGGGAPPAQVVAGPDAATFGADVTVPDDTVMTPGEIFEKVWRISNTGTTTWTEDYSLVFVDGELMGAPASVPIGEEVEPGEDVEVSVEMAAPESPGSYISYWKMSTADGVVFGFGAAANEAIWVKITVEGPEALNAPSDLVSSGLSSARTLNLGDVARLAPVDLISNQVNSSVSSG